MFAVNTGCGACCQPKRLVGIALALVLLLLATSGSILASPPRQTPPPTPLIATSPRLLTDPVPDPRQPGVVWFPQTGHTLRGPFLDYWNKYGGLAQFGYPLTEEFFEEVGPDHRQYRVQYFERNRFEHHPENKGTQYEVLLGALGRDFHEPDPPAPALPEASYFPETGHNLGGVFRTYWHEHGGLFVHGYPITEEYQEKNPTDGKTYTVQYFERSRFEHHPENNGTQYEVLLGLLGTQLAQKKGYPYGWYPLYGYAADWSWVAGYYKSDGRKLPYTGCSTIRYAHPDSIVFGGPGEVLAYAAGYDPNPRQPQPHPLGEGDNEPRLRPTSDPKNFLVVLGQLDDPSSITQVPTELSCLEPRFKVDRLQFNPAR
jgi:hypothetical protein